MTNSGWKVKDFVVGAMIAVVIGLLLMVWSNIYMPLSPILGPVGVEILYGPYFIPGLLCLYIIRKPGAALYGGIVAGIAELLAGSPFGINIIVAGIVQGGATDLVFAATKYKKYSWLNVVIAGAFTAIAIYLRDFFVFGYSTLGLKTNIAMIIIRIVSGALLGGIISKIIGEALAKTGVLKNFGINKN